MFRLVWERVRASSRCNLIDKVLLKIARSGNDYRGAFNGNRRCAGVFRLRSFYMISAESVDGSFCVTIFQKKSKQNLILNCLQESA